MDGRSDTSRVPLEAHPHFAIARRLWDAIALGDGELLSEVLSEKSVWRMLGRSTLAGTYVGVDAIFDFLARVGESTDDLQSDVSDIYVSEAGGVIRYRVRALRGVQTLDSEQLFVFHVEDGVIDEAFLAPVDPYAYDRFFVLQ